MGKRVESELTVVTRAKELCQYILTITDKSPKKFRFTLVSRLQNYSLSVIEHLIMFLLQMVMSRSDVKSGWNCSMRR